MYLGISTTSKAHEKDSPARDFYAGPGLFSPQFSSANVEFASNLLIATSTPSFAPDMSL